MNSMELLFWLSFALIFYVHFGYPLVLMVWQRTAPRSLRKMATFEPTVSIVIAIHNERQRIAQRLENCLAVDYPKRKMQIIVSLDGPTDGSEFLVWKYARQGVELIHSRQHAGKAVALNRAVRRATGEIVLFADARQTFAVNAVRELVANFADESVGAVSGELILTASSDASACDVGLYWRYEKALRSMESAIHSVPGATGAIYAIRRALYEDLPPDTILDDVITPLRLVLKGKRAVFEPQAKAYDVVACCANAEYTRKVRTLYGNYQLLTQLPQALLPWRNPIFFQFLSHKVGRLLVPWALASLFVTNLFMLHGIYILLFALQATWYAFASVGYLITRPVSVLPMPIQSEGERAA